jgi:hypothetical protein
MNLKIFINGNGQQFAIVAQGVHMMLEIYSCQICRDSERQFCLPRRSASPFGSGQSFVKVILARKDSLHHLGKIFAVFVRMIGSSILFSVLQDSRAERGRRAG